MTGNITPPSPDLKYNLYNQIQPDSPVPTEVSEEEVDDYPDDVDSDATTEEISDKIEVEEKKRACQCTIL